MGLEPWVAGFKAQSNPLSYGGRPPTERCLFLLWFKAAVVPASASVALR